MNFFEHQDQARRNTTLLIVLFGVAIASMILMLYGVSLLISIWFDAGFLSSVALRHRNGSGIWHPTLFMFVTIGTFGFVGLGSLFKILQLRQGGKVIAQSMGGLQVNIQTQDEGLRQLLNVVEEMAIASGVPVPPVYVMTDEPGINAFAAGFTVNDAVIGVTRGCVEQLSRDELQGVIAHEFSHILNGDMRLNLRMLGVLQGILIIYLVGRVITRSGTYSRGKISAGMVGLGLALVGIGGIGFLCGRLIKSAVSRQREFLADASAVQFTRNPYGISSALQKIGGFSQGSRMTSPKAEEASHMFFGQIGRGGLANPFSTHPPLKERIRRLESLSKNSAFMAELEHHAPASTRVANAPLAEGVMGFQAGSAQTPPKYQANTRPSNDSASSVPPSRHIHLDADRVVPSIGTTDPAHIVYARAFLDRLPSSLRGALRTPWGAQAVIYGLLLDVENVEVRDRQLTHLKQTEPLDTVNTVQQVSSVIAQLDPRTRLPLVDLTIPALRDLSKEDVTRFFKQIQHLVRADGRLSLSEYTLQIVLQRRLHPYFKTSKETAIKYTSIGSVWNDCLNILAGLARVGHTTADEVTYAFRTGIYCLPGARNQEIPKAPSTPGLYEIGKSLTRLAHASPKIKQGFVDACAHTVLVDNTVTPREAELLRAIVISLDCPIPPFLDAATR